MITALFKYLLVQQSIVKKVQTAIINDCLKIAWQKHIKSLGENFLKQKNIEEIAMKCLKELAKKEFKKQILKYIKDIQNNNQSIKLENEEIESLSK